jgi:DNA (cytosine-5)-methyltransferase 1
MKQRSLFSYSKTVGLSPRTRVVDLFCGIGGFSEGARMAGHEVVLAVDCDPLLIGAHVQQNPHCDHMCCRLPRDDLPLPRGGEWHLHGSPPCTKLSIMVPHQRAAEQKEAIDLVAWFLELVLAKQPSSWSFEQVNHEDVRAQLEKLRRRHPRLVDWIVVDAVDFGVPQNRRRVIAGSPFLIANLRSPALKRKRCVRDVMPDPPREFIRNNLYSRPDDKTHEYYAVPLKDQLRSVDEPSYTILATGHKRWSDAHGNVLRHLTAAEGALIQSFPPGYPLPWDPFIALIGVGNAVPPLLAKALMTPTRAA